MDLSKLLEATGLSDALAKSGILFVIVCTLLQIAPIKINPWSWIGKLIGTFFHWLGSRIGKALNGEVMAKLGAMDSRLDDMETRLGDLEEHNRTQDASNAEEKALDARRRILSFGDEIRSGVRHSKERFDNIFEDIKYYKDYCDNHRSFENDRVHISIDIIESTYKKCTLENDFL